MEKLKALRFSKPLLVILGLILLGSIIYGAYWYGQKKPLADASWFQSATGAINDYVQFKGQATGQINLQGQNQQVIIEALNQLTQRVEKLEKK